MMSCCGDSLCVLMTFQGQESWIQATCTKITLWAKSRRAHRVFNEAEAMWLVKIGQYNSQAKLVGMQGDSQEVILNCQTSLTSG